MLAAGTILPNWVAVRSIQSALIFAFAPGIINAVLRPVPLVFAIPFNLLTLGLFTFILNAGLFWLALKLPTGVQIDGFTGALIGSLRWRGELFRQSTAR